MKGRKIGDIFLPSIFLPTENRGGIHYGDCIRPILKNRSFVQLSEPIAAPMENISFVEKGSVERANDQRSEEAPHRKI